MSFAGETYVQEEAAARPLWGLSLATVMVILAAVMYGVVTLIDGAPTLVEVPVSDQTRLGGGGLLSAQVRPELVLPERVLPEQSVPEEAVPVDTSTTVPAAEGLVSSTKALDDGWISEVAVEGGFKAEFPTEPNRLRVAGVGGEDSPRTEFVARRPDGVILALVSSLYDPESGAVDDVLTATVTSSTKELVGTLGSDESVEIAGTPWREFVVNTNLGVALNRVAIFGERQYLFTAFVPSSAGDASIASADFDRMTSSFEVIG